MITIIETALDFTESNPQSVQVPNGSEIVACRLVAKNGDEVLVLWLLTDPAETLMHERKFVIINTGGQAPGSFVKYIGTFKTGAAAEYQHVLELTAGV